jgi:hypothetical protein
MVLHYFFPNLIGPKYVIVNLLKFALLLGPYGSIVELEALIPLCNIPNLQLSNITGIVHIKT